MGAEEITAMMKLTKVEASTPDGNVGEATVFDYSYSAVEFPLWKVAIGETSTYTVPGTATPTPVLTTSPRSACNLRSREPRSLVNSCLGPTWRLLIPLAPRVAVLTQPALPPLLPGPVVRL